MRMAVAEARHAYRGQRKKTLPTFNNLKQSPVYKNQQRENNCLPRKKTSAQKY